MINYKKTLVGGIITFFIGTSCCWLSSLAVWFGGAAAIGTIASYIESTQSILILVSVLFLLITLVLYNKTKRKSSSGKSTI